VGCPEGETDGTGVGLELVGKSVGRAVGEVGLAVGFAVGTSSFMVGLAEGKMLGANVGKEVGTGLVGLSVGKKVGRRVGTVEGKSVGIQVGEEVPTLVGSGDGKDVGATPWMMFRLRILAAAASLHGSDAKTCTGLYVVLVGVGKVTVSVPLDVRDSVFLVMSIVIESENQEFRDSEAAGEI